MRSADKYCRCPPTPTDAASFSEFLNTARMNKPQVRKMSYSPAGWVLWPKTLQLSCLNILMYFCDFRGIYLSVPGGDLDFLS